MTTPRIPTGRAIRSAREARCWTQTRLAEELAKAGYIRHVKPHTISSIENDRREVPRFMLASLLRAMPELANGEQKLRRADQALADADRLAS